MVRQHTPHIQVFQSDELVFFNEPPVELMVKVATLDVDRRSSRPDAPAADVLSHGFGWRTSSEIVDGQAAPFLLRLAVGSGGTIRSPVDRVANSRSPRSSPTGRPPTKTGSAISTSIWMLTKYFPFLVFDTVRFFIGPSSGRCSTGRT